jgi:hypothetical protein
VAAAAAPTVVRSRVAAAAPAVEEPGNLTVENRALRRQLEQVGLLCRHSCAVCWCCVACVSHVGEVGA